MSRDRRVTIEIAGKENVSSATKGATNALDQLKSKTSELTTTTGRNAVSMVSAWATVAGAIYAAQSTFRTIQSLVQGSLKAFQDSERAAASFRAAMLATGQEWEVAGVRISRLAGELQRLTGVSDDATMGAAALLVQIGDLTEYGLEQALPVLQDLSTAIGMDLSSAAEAFAQTVSGGENALKRFGVDLTNIQDPTERFTSAIEQLQQSFGGFASQMAETSTGSMQLFKAALDDFKKIGGEMIANFLRPATGALTDYIIRLNDAIRAKHTLNSLHGVETIEATMMRIGALEDQRRAIEREITETERERQQAEQRLSDGNLRMARMNEAAAQELRNRVAEMSARIDEQRNHNLRRIDEEIAAEQRLLDTIRDRLGLANAPTVDLSPLVQRPPDPVAEAAAAAARFSADWEDMLSATGWFLKDAADYYYEMVGRQAAEDWAKAAQRAIQITDEARQLAYEQPGGMEKMLQDRVAYLFDTLNEALELGLRSEVIEPLAYEIQLVEKELFNLQNQSKQLADEFVEARGKIGVLVDAVKDAIDTVFQFDNALLRSAAAVIKSLVANVAVPLGKAFVGLGESLVGLIPVDRIMSSLIGALSGVGGWVQDNVFGPIADKVSEWGAALKERLGPIFDNVREFLGPVMEPLQGMFGRLGEVGGAVAGLFGTMMGAIGSLITSTESFGEIMAAVNELLLAAVEQVVLPLIEALRPLIDLVLVLVANIAAMLVPIIEMLGQLIRATMPFWIALANVMQSLMGVVQQLMPPIMMVVEIILRALAPVLVGISAIFDALAVVLYALQPVFEALGLAVKVVMTPIAVLGAVFQWLGNVIKNLGTFISNVVDRPLRPGTWGRGMESTNLGRLIEDAVAGVWQDTADYSFDPAGNPPPITAADIPSVSGIAGGQTATGVYGGATTVQSINLEVHVHIGETGLNVIDNQTAPRLGDILQQIIGQYVQSGGTVQWLGA